MKLKDFLSTNKNISEAAPNSKMKEMLRNMARYEMEIRSFGTGLGIAFIDKNGRHHYEESTGDGTKTNSLTLEAMVDFAMSEIEAYSKRKFQESTDETEFKIGKYQVSLDQDDDGFYWIHYTPELPPQIERRFNKASSVADAKVKAQKAIDEVGTTNESSNWVKTPAGLYRNLDTNVLSKVKGGVETQSNEEKLEYYKKELARLKAKPNAFKSHIREVERQIKRLSK